MKRINGTGCVYKMSGKRRKPWAAVITVSRKGGKQERRMIGTYETKKEALYALTTPRHLVLNKSITVADLYALWSKERLSIPLPLHLL